MSFPVSPIDNLVFVAPEAQSGLVEIPDARRALRGRVLAAGPKVSEVKVNDMVRLALGKAIEAVFDQRRVWITRESELLAVESDA